ncbi:magnesium chelatase ATPase subunit D [Meridianimarinicoccus roseus]|uniref:Mg-protoporphyrin IX chelatase n=1 Tax=Meridianimarinicoccus roseus TaxID=2072018 RepID=A0A2V2LDG3_9RHOB|nr:magnesium chelatase subunit D [Meridianimarinicoccus roseus]PWR03092.1 magnesium chelatase ATPase subunit D [Meridianimarinicoccus roseus]
MGDGWARACLAMTLLAVDPGGLRGLHLRARSGPVRDAALARLADVPLPRRRVHPAIGDDALFGGLDLAATLAAGRVVRRPGLLAAPAAIVLAMAERCAPQLAARLGQALDAGTGHALVLLDEGAEDDEGAPRTLTERLAFSADLSGIGYLAVRRVPPMAAAALDAARERLAGVTVPEDAAGALVALAARFGIDSLRAPLLALRAARAHAALAGRDAVGPEDLAAAAGLVYPPRATRLPQEDAPEPEPPQDDPDRPDDMPDDKAEGEDRDPLQDIPEELLVDAIAALLPPDLLHRLAAAPARAARGAAGSGAGARRQGNRRGRPLPSRPGKLDGTARIDLVATLRAAAPWQPIRRRERPGKTGLHIHPVDIRLKRFEERSDRLLIFTVDASGSAAMARLAEAKGAVELLLAEAYARRDHVSLIAFRGAGAEALLPPTRSLVQTKRRLAGLPGGGGTPLAAGLRAGLEAALQARARGLTPTLALLTDGRANIALDGSAGRTQAGVDAAQMARALRAAGIPALVLDTGARPQPALRDLAAKMGAPYMPLPRADARRMSAAIGAALED